MVLMGVVWARTVGGMNAPIARMRAPQYFTFRLLPHCNKKEPTRAEGRDTAPCSPYQRMLGPTRKSQVTVFPNLCQLVDEPVDVTAGVGVQMLASPQDIAAPRSRVPGRRGRSPLRFCGPCRVQGRAAAPPSLSETKASSTSLATGTDSSRR